MATAGDLTHPLVCLATILRHVLQLPDYLVVGPWGRFAISCTLGLSAEGPSHRPSSPLLSACLLSGSSAPRVPWLVLSLA